MQALEGLQDAHADLLPESPPQQSRSSAVVLHVQRMPASEDLIRGLGSQDYSHAEKKAANNMSDCPMEDGEEGEEETAPYPTYGRRSSQMEELFSDLPSQQAISNSSSPAVAASDPPSKMQKLNPPVGRGKRVCRGT